MKLTIKFAKGNWHTFKKIKDMSIVKAIDRNIVKYIRETKLYER